ncbi:MAG: hypothetical protein K2M91_14570 [Lachnospiraceae bacterium]|nr:hypothetical protein [Lachnospiraceae bacterium]
MNMIHINDEHYQHMAFVWGLNYDLENKVIYGERRGYPFLIYVSNTSAPLMFTITTSATSEQCPQIGNEEKKLIKSRASMLSLVVQRDSKITALSTNAYDIDVAKKNVECILNALVSFMKEKGFVPCCESCKRAEHTEILQTGYEYRHLCSQCEEHIAAQSRQNISSSKAVMKNGITGIVSAIIGALMGIAFMTFLVSHIGNFLTLIVSGFFVGAITIKLGMCIGDRPSKTVKFVVALIAVLAVFVGYNAGIAMAFVVSRGMSVGGAIITYVINLLTGGADMKTWMELLAITYIAAAVGGIISYKSESKKFGSAYKIAYIGRTQNVNGVTP